MKHTYTLYIGRHEGRGLAEDSQVRKSNLMRSHLVPICRRGEETDGRTD